VYNFVKSVQIYFLYRFFSIFKIANSMKWIDQIKRENLEEGNLSLLT